VGSGLAVHFRRPVSGDRFGKVAQLLAEIIEALEFFVLEALDILGAYRES